MESSPSVAIIGLFGVSGAGKSFLLRLLAKNTFFKPFLLLEGSKVIESCVPGGLDHFKSLPAEEKYDWRQHAIQGVKRRAERESKRVIITGHCSFWDQYSGQTEHVMTDADMNTYTHIFYLDTAPEVVAAQREQDSTRDRNALTIDQIRNWQGQEKQHLWQICLHHNILVKVTEQPSHLVITHMKSLLEDLLCASEATSSERILETVECLLPKQTHPWHTVLLLDGDRTLVAEDTGRRFWELLYDAGVHAFGRDPLKAVFSGPSPYTYRGFLQALLLFDDAFRLPENEDVCNRLALSTQIRPEFRTIMDMVQRQEGVGVIVVSCGPSLLWQRLFIQQGLNNIGILASEFSNGQRILTPSIKGQIVDHLRLSHGLRVWAFGDGPLDFHMLQSADRSFVVFDERNDRAERLTQSLMQYRGHVEQFPCALNGHSPVNLTSVPTIDIEGSRFEDELRNSRRWIECTKHAACQLLATPMRNAQIHGPPLRDAHRAVGKYLAQQHLSRVLGLEKYRIPHVQHHDTSGFRFRNEDHTVIVALMRGGEPMAQGVSDAMPRASLVHAKFPSELPTEQVQECQNLVIVDSVINTGDSIVQFIKELRARNISAQLFVLCGVMQECTWLSKDFRMLMDHQRVTIIALRVSTNSFIGKGGTDTGNRLFNTM